MALEVRTDAAEDSLRTGQEPASSCSSGVVARKEAHARLLKACTLCPRACGVNRFERPGFCGADARLKINLAQLHFGEEPVLSGQRGSGTIFFSHCNLRCVFCQNYQISHLGAGRYSTPEELADVMLDLEGRGAHNINLVSPTHYTLQIAQALGIAKGRGLAVPVVWNSNGYEKVDTLRLLESLVQVYLPDFKYSDPENSARYSGARDYPQVVRNALLEMQRQVGDLVVRDGLAVRGLIIRVLLLPDDLGDVDDTLRWIRDHLGTQVAVSLMAQYYPAYRASEFPELNRILRPDELEFARSLLAAYGFHNGFVQEIVGNSRMTPDFVQQGMAGH